jgi:hypothetical protein
MGLEESRRGGEARVSNGVAGTAGGEGHG